MNLDETIQAIKEEWDNLHHNVSLLHINLRLPDDEAEEFDYVIAIETRKFISYLTATIEERWSWTLALYQYGRGGATIAPDTWMAPAAGDVFGCIREELFFNTFGLDGYNEMRRILAILRFINAECKTRLNRIKDWWPRYLQDQTATLVPEVEV